MGSVDYEDYSRFPKATLRVQPCDKEKPETTSSGESDESDLQLDAKHQRLSFSSELPLDGSYYPTRRRWSLSGRPASATPLTVLRAFRAGKVRIAITLNSVYFVSADTCELKTLSSFCGSSKWGGGNKVFGVNSLEISRLPDGDWKKVETTIL